MYRERRMEKRTSKWEESWRRRHMRLRNMREMGINFWASGKKYFGAVEGMGGAVETGLLFL